MIVLPEELSLFFIQAGWYEGRTINVASEFANLIPENHPATEILSSFGDLTLSEQENASGHDIKFISSASEYDPDWNEGDIAVWNELLKTTLILIAKTDQGQSELYVDNIGRCFGLSLIVDAFYFIGESFIEAMHRELYGLYSRPMIRPDQKSVMLYGVNYPYYSPEIYKYD